MKVIAKADVHHGVYSLVRGREHEIPDGIAADLEKAGFVRPVEAKAQAAAATKVAGPSSNKKR